MAVKRFASSAKAAKAMGLNRYFTGKPCRQGHYAERYACLRWCVARDLARLGLPEDGAKPSRPPILITQRKLRSKAVLPPLAWGGSRASCARMAMRW